MTNNAKISTTGKFYLTTEESGRSLTKNQIKQNKLYIFFQD